MKVLMMIAMAAGLLILIGLFAMRLLAADPAARAEGFSPAERAEAYPPLSPPDWPGDGSLAVYHLGHSLVGREMPAFFAAMAGHGYHSQLGWGASLNQHLQGDVPGLAEENQRPAFRPAGEAIASGDYPVVVLTEMVDLQDAIRFHDSKAAFLAWISRIRAARPEARIFLYETWHDRALSEGQEGGWTGRIAADLPGLWEGHLLRAAFEAGEGPVYLIPGGQVMRAFDRAARAGEIEGLASAGDLFSDQIHFNQTGAWLMALTHYAVILQRSPEEAGLAAPLGGAGISPSAAAAMRALVWQVVRETPGTGLAGALAAEGAE